MTTTGYGRAADMTVAEMVRQPANYVSPMCDTELGRQLFDSGYGRHHCRTALQAAGWDERQRQARHHYLCLCLEADMHQIAEAR